MTPEHFHTIQREAGLTNRKLAALLRVSDEKTIRRWQSGERPVSGPVSLLMELIERGAL